MLIYWTHSYCYTTSSYLTNAVSKPLLLGFMLYATQILLLFRVTARLRTLSYQFIDKNIWRFTR